MASLTPGLLSKLLENAGNKDVRLTGDHRSPLLQVIEILPSLSSSHPWHSTGFFLKLSDSLHSAYVSIPHDDLDLIYTDKIQLGQFVSVSRLDAASPVPVLRGLKPLPWRRPCLGTPKDLVSSDLLLPIPVPSSSSTPTVLNFTKQKKHPSNSKPVASVLNKHVSPNKTCVASNATKCANNLWKKDSKVEPQEMRRLSLDSATARKFWDPTPPPKTPSTAAPLLLKSPNNVRSDKKALSKNDPSLKCPPSSTLPLKSKNEVSSLTKTAKPLRKDVTKSDSDISSCHVKLFPISQTWSEQKISWDVLPSSIQNLGKETVCHRNAAFLAAARALEEASALEGVIRCMQAFAELCKLSHQVSSGSLVEQYLDLHENMQKAAMVANSLLNPSQPGEKSRLSSDLQCFMRDVSNASTNRNAPSWIRAAIETNLSKFSLFRKPEKYEIMTSDKCYRVILENTPENLTSKNQSPQSIPSPRNSKNLSNSSGKRVPPLRLKQHIVATKRMNPEKQDGPKGSGIKEAASLAENLLFVSHEWFLKYVDDSLSTRFGLSEGESSEIGFLRQLKRLNHWLDDVVGNGVKVDEKIEKLRKKLYGFLIQQVDLARFDGK